VPNISSVVVRAVAPVIGGIVGPVSWQAVWNIDNQIHAQHCYSNVPTEL
jgi:hypothetical protein